MTTPTSYQEGSSSSFAKVDRWGNLDDRQVSLLGNNTKVLGPGATGTIAGVSVTVNAPKGKIISENRLNAGISRLLDVTNSYCTPESIVLLTVQGFTASGPGIAATADLEFVGNGLFRIAVTNGDINDIIDGFKVHFVLL